MTELTAQAADMVTQPRQAILAVHRDHGGPHLTVVWFHWDGQAFLISTLRQNAKVGYIRRNPNVTLLINDDERYVYVTAEGPAELRETGHLELTRNLFAKYLPDDDPTAAGRDPNRIVIRLRPERVIGHP